MTSAPTPRSATTSRTATGGSASLGTGTTARRLEGYRAALAVAGIPRDHARIELGAGSGAAAGRVALVLLARPDPPTALFSSGRLGHMSHP